MQATNQKSLSDSHSSGNLASLKFAGCLEKRKFYTFELCLLRPDIQYVFSMKQALIFLIQPEQPILNSHCLLKDLLIFHTPA